jgi:carboxylesterase
MTDGASYSSPDVQPVEPHPAATRDEALLRWHALEALDDDNVDPEGGSRLLEPGRPEGELAGHAIVLLHGLCNSPRQFRPLAERFVARGATVLLPRLPRHGLRDRMTRELSQLHAEEAVRTLSTAIDVAAGLGSHVTVAGLSVGGILAGWAAQHKPIDRAVLIAPSIGYPPLPLSVARPLFAALRRLPDWYVWWDIKLRERLPGPTYAYPRFSTRAIARLQRLGFSLLDEARHTAPRAREVWLVTNAGDGAVDNSASRRLAARWRAVSHDPASIREHRFPRSIGVGHDVVDPHQPYARTRVVYPVLERIIATAEADPAPSPNR